MKKPIVSSKKVLVNTNKETQNDTLVLDKQSCPQKMKTGVIKQENSEMFSTFWLAISSLSR